MGRGRKPEAADKKKGRALKESQAPTNMADIVVTEKKKLAKLNDRISDIDDEDKREEKRARLADQRDAQEVKVNILTANALNGGCTPEMLQLPYKSDVDGQQIMPGAFSPTPPTADPKPIPTMIEARQTVADAAAAGASRSGLSSTPPRPPVVEKEVVASAPTSAPAGEKPTETRKRRRSLTAAGSL